VDARLPISVVVLVWETCQADTNFSLANPLNITDILFSDLCMLLKLDMIVVTITILVKSEKMVYSMYTSYSTVINSTTSVYANFHKYHNV
jgi:hypothetical protein